MIVSLLAVALSGSLWLLIAASFFVGLPPRFQLFVMAARLANDGDRGRAIGIVMIATVAE